MILVSGDTSISHGKFVEWLNKEITAPTAGFWKPLVDFLKAQLMIKKIPVFMQEFYATNQTTLVGFAVFSGLDTTDLDVYYFDKDGTPLYYNNHDAKELILVNLKGKPTEFNAGNSIPMKNVAGEVVMELTIAMENLYGCYTPVFVLQQNNLSVPEAKALLDVEFDNKISASYAVYVEPDLPQVKYTVVNLLKQSLLLSVPYFTWHSEDIRLEAEQTVFIFKTPHSEYYLRQLEEKGLIKYYEPIVI